MPVASVVTPCLTLAWCSGSVMSLSSEWECMSMNPGQTTEPATSMTRPAWTWEVSPLTTVTVSPVIPRLARNQVWPVPSTIRPFRSNRSNMVSPQ